MLRWSGGISHAGLYPHGSGTLSRAVVLFLHVTSGTNTRGLVLTQYFKVLGFPIIMTSNPTVGE